MFNKDSILDVLNDLNKELRHRDLALNLIMIGGGALLLKDIRTDLTRDIDTITTLNSEVKDIIKEIAHRRNLPEKWLNDHSSVFTNEADIGLEPYTDYNFSNIRISIPDRQSFLEMKILAELDRGFDKKDIISLRPTKKELDQLESEMKKLGRSSDLDIDELFEHLRRVLGYED